MTRTSPLAAWHAAHGARFVDFGGWEMPLHYGSTIAEHRAVRTSVGFFDVSHLGRIAVDGSGSTDALRRLLCNDVARIEPGRTQYTMLLDEEGGVLDDIVVWRWEEERYWVLPNAANHDLVLSAIGDAGGAPVDLREGTAMIAVQGPDAPAVLDDLLGAAPRRFRTATGRWNGADVPLAGTGYTGERGGELVVPPDIGRSLAEALAGSGATPCGLGARDTLRLEAGLPLWGNELGPGTTPVEAGLGWVVSLEDPARSFPGRDAVAAQLASGAPRRLVGFRLPDRRVPRHGYRMRADGGEGVVTSGNFSPVLGVGIGLGYLPSSAAGPLEVEIRGVWVPADEVSLPFVRTPSA